MIHAQGGYGYGVWVGDRRMHVLWQALADDQTAEGELVHAQVGYLDPRKGCPHGSGSHVASANPYLIDPRRNIKPKVVYEFLGSRMELINGCGYCRQVIAKSSARFPLVVVDHAGDINLAFQF